MQQKADDGLVVGLGRVGRHGLGVEAGRVDIHARARMDDIGDDQADDQGQGREHQEIHEGLEGHAADLVQVAHAGDACDYGQEDHRRDDHLHQLDEAIAQRLERLAQRRPEVADRCSQDDSGQHLKIEVLIKRLGPRVSGLADRIHCHPLGPAERPCFQPAPSLWRLDRRSLVRGTGASTLQRMV